MSTIAPRDFKYSLKGVSFQHGKAYAERIEDLASLKSLDSVEVQKAGSLYADFEKVADFVKARDQTGMDRDLAQGSVALLNATQPLSESLDRLVSHVRNVDALSKPDGSMMIEAGKSYFRGEANWPARTYKVSPDGVVLMKEGSFAAQYDPAQKVLSWG